MPSAGFWWAQLTTAGKDRAVEDAAKKAAERFAQHWQTLADSVGMKPPPPRERLRAYRNRLPQVWAALRAEFPVQYGDDLDDWRALEEKYGAELDATQDVIEGQGSGREVI